MNLAWKESSPGVWEVEASGFRYAVEMDEPGEIFLRVIFNGTNIVMGFEVYEKQKAMDRANDHAAAISSAIEAACEPLVKLLNEHHAWHLAQGEQDPTLDEIHMGREYADSDMYERTEAALQKHKEKL